MRGLVPHMVPHIMAPDQEQDSARSRSAPSDQRTLSCRIGTRLARPTGGALRASPGAPYRRDRRADLDGQALAIAFVEHVQRHVKMNSTNLACVV